MRNHHTRWQNTVQTSILFFHICLYLYLFLFTIIWLVCLLTLQDEDPHGQPSTPPSLHFAGSSLDSSPAFELLILPWSTHSLAPLCPAFLSSLQASYYTISISSASIQTHYHHHKSKANPYLALIPCALPLITSSPKQKPNPCLISKSPWPESTSQPAHNHLNLPFN